MMTSQELTEYLKQISTLESAIYKQEEIIKTANKNLKKRQISKPTLKKPELKLINAPELEQTEPVALTVCGVFGLGFIIGGITSIGNIIGIISFVIGLIMIAIGIISFLILKIRHNKEFERKMQDYERAISDYEKAYQEEMAQNHKAYYNAMELYNQKDEIATKNYQKAKHEVKLLDKPLMDTKLSLAKLYDKDIIFPKYRNLFAMCTIYEYFASGRCSELTGANGAYNLYEQELRQNLVINQLEQVNHHLDQIKQNQYVLYQAISETNQALHEISDEVKNIVNAVTDIAVSSRITAYCSHITAVNAQAQTYIALLE